MPLISRWDREAFWDALGKCHSFEFLCRSRVILSGVRLCSFGLAYSIPSVGPVGTGAKGGPLPFQAHKDVSAEEKRKAPVECARRSRPADIGKGSIGRTEEAVEVAYLK